MKKPKRATPGDPISKPEKAPPTEDRTSEKSCPEEAAGGAAIGGTFGLIGGALEDDEKKSRW